MLLERFGLTPAQVEDLPALFVDELLIKMNAYADETTHQERIKKVKHG